MAARLWLYAASAYSLYGLLEQEASPFGEVGSVASRMLTTSLVAFVRDEPGALLALTQVATATSLSILDISSRSRSPSAAWPAMGAFEIRVRLNSLAQLEELTAASAVGRQRAARLDRDDARGVGEQLLAGRRRRPRSGPATVPLTHRQLSVTSFASPQRGKEHLL